MFKDPIVVLLFLFNTKNIVHRLTSNVNVLYSLLSLCIQVIHGLSTLCVRRVAWGTRTRSRLLACCAFRWRHVRRAATWACGALPNQRSGSGRHGSKSKATSADAAWALSRTRRKVQWPGHGHWPAVWPGEFAEPEEAGCAQFRCCRACHPCMCTFLLLLIPILTCLNVLCLMRSAVKRSAAVAPTRRTLCSHQQESENIWGQTLSASAASGVPLCAAAARAPCMYSAPYSICVAQTVRPLLPGQTLPQGVAAVTMTAPGRHRLD